LFNAIWATLVLVQSRPNREKKAESGHPDRDEFFPFFYLLLLNPFLLRLLFIWSDNLITHLRPTFISLKRRRLAIHIIEVVGSIPRAKDEENSKARQMKKKS